MEQIIHIPAGDVELEGALNVPEGASQIVIFAHGSGSSRQSPRNKMVSEVLNKNKIATLLFDLLTSEEDISYENRFNIDLLKERLLAATRWVLNKENLSGFSIGYFGASTGSAAALKAAAELGDQIKAVVSRGGRPDMAVEELGDVLAPTLLLVGGDDTDVIELNKMAAGKIRCYKELVIIPGATHLFEEPGKLQEVAAYAAGWFKNFLR